jgi:hypothetical protein
MAARTARAWTARTVTGPDQVDQVKRLRAFRDANLGVVILPGPAPWWLGEVTVRGQRRQCDQQGLGPLLDELDRVLREAAVMDAIEEDFPGWRVWRSRPVRHWWATRTGEGAHCDKDYPKPMTVTGSNEEQLRAALAEAEAPGPELTGMLAG